MAALNFPSSPTNGQVFGNWIYSSSKGAWQAKPLEQTVAITSPTAPSSPTNGDLWYNTNDGSTYVYYTDVDGSQWVELKSDVTLSSTIGPRVDALELRQALVPISPTSATATGGSTSISSDGLVSFTTGSTYSNGIVINGCFSAKYANYKIIFTSTSGPANAGVYLQLSQSGTANTSNYLYAVSNGSDTTAGSEYELTYLNYLGHTTTEITVYQPFNAFHTRLSSEFFYDDASGGTFIYRKMGGTHRNTGSFDGFKIWNPTNMSGTIRVFGIKD